VKIVGGVVLPLKILERPKMSNNKETRRDDDRKKLFRKIGNGCWLLTNKRCEKK